MVAAGRGILLSKTPKLIAAFMRTAYTLKMVWHIRHDHPSIGSAQGLELRLKIVVRDGSVYSFSSRRGKSLTVRQKFDNRFRRWTLADSNEK